MRSHGPPPGSRSLLYWILLAYLLGAVAAAHLSLSRPVLVLLPAALVASGLFAIIQSKRGSSIVFWIVCFFWLGILAFRIRIDPPLPGNHVSNFADGNRAIVEGMLSRPPDKSIRRTRLRVRVETLVRGGRAIPCTGTILVSLPPVEDDFLRYGDRVRFSANLRHPANFNNPGGFDYERYLAARGIWTTAFVDKPERIIRVAAGVGNPFWMWLEGVRTRFRLFLGRHSTPSASPILKALVLGERGTIPERVKEDFAASGAAHIMAISGLHLGIIAFFLFQGILWILRRSETLTLRTNIFKLSALLTIPPVAFYTLVAGGRISTVRAFVMITAYFVSLIIDRPRDLYHTLALAALVITLADPAALTEASFQLSFMAVLAILFLYPRLNRLFQREEILPHKGRGLIRRFTSWGRSLFLVSLAAMIGTGPLIAYHFNRFSPLGLISNFLVIPLLGFLVVPTLLLAMVLSLCSCPLAAPLVGGAGWIVDLTATAIHELASLPWTSFRVATPTVLEIVLVYGLFAAVAHARRSPLYGAAIAVILSAGAVDAGYWIARTRFNQNLRITCLDVGQGDCALVEFPKGRRALIDGGGFYDDAFDIGRNVVAPFLWKKKIRRIDFLVLTHPDPDHLNGLKFIARTFPVGELWDSGQQSGSVSFREFMTIVRRKGIPRVSLFRGDEPRIINGVSVFPLNPAEGSSEAPGGRRRSRTNNLSLVLRLVFGNQAFLFTGDIEKETEEELAASGLDLRSRVIKVPHHGSRTSSTG
ncbi:MAG: DNA internalization-related competence protein ComEC/Rec2, partial [Deltaproteobacteria bacterium]|nr:DNA internalization-related competence protein ComEC/Rec2 [Deltaproteobacteria bacterium]